MSFSLDYLKRSVIIDATDGGLAYTEWRDIDLTLHSIIFRILPEFSFGEKYKFFFSFGKAEFSFPQFGHPVGIIFCIQMLVVIQMVLPIDFNRSE